MKRYFCQWYCERKKTAFTVGDEEFIRAKSPRDAIEKFKERKPIESIPPPADWESNGKGRYENGIDYYINVRYRIFFGHGPFTQETYCYLWGRLRRPDHGGVSSWGPR